MTWKTWLCFSHFTLPVAHINNNPHGNHTLSNATWRETRLKITSNLTSRSQASNLQISTKHKVSRIVTIDSTVLVYYWRITPPPTPPPPPPTLVPISFNFMLFSAKISTESQGLEPPPSQPPGKSWIRHCLCPLGLPEEILDKKMRFMLQYTSSTPLHASNIAHQSPPEQCHMHA